jgi:hypothetical protein
MNAKALNKGILSPKDGVVKVDIEASVFERVKIGVGTLICWNVYV